MDFGIVTAKIDEIGYITHAENLGYSHCWVTDSPMNGVEFNVKHEERANLPWRVGANLCVKKKIETIAFSVMNDPAASYGISSTAKSLFL